MKSSTLFLLACLISFSVFANNPALVKSEKNTAQELEYNNVLENLLISHTEILNPFVNEKCKVIILDDKFNTIREETIDKIEDICNQSMLTPTIYRSEFILKISNVSYYMLRNDKID